jgi:hypothetical protein
VIFRDTGRYNEAFLIVSTVPFQEQPRKDVSAFNDSFLDARVLLSMCRIVCPELTSRHENVWEANADKACEEREVE